MYYYIFIEFSLCSIAATRFFNTEYSIKRTYNGSEVNVIKFWLSFGFTDDDGVDVDGDNCCVDDDDDDEDNQEIDVLSGQDEALQRQMWFFFNTCFLMQFLLLSVFFPFPFSKFPFAF